MSSKLTLDDIADLRAYERERDEFRARVIELKKRRRVAVGPFVTLLFENRDTIRFQIQEMARVEKIISDEGVQGELDVYNPLIPGAGSLAATLFIELTTKDDLLTWLPQLVGIERAVELRIGEGPVAEDGATSVVTARPDPAHDKQLTRETTTASVHYVHFDLSPDQVAQVAAGPVSLAVTLPTYAFAANLSKATIDELVADLNG
ncbi:MAG: hypothetical protein QOC60_1061 [Frankiaceae bacterium]|nr:hypothetical protein [Frankiaceae bacterium]